MHGHALRLVVLPAVAAALSASLMLAAPASAGTPKSVYIAQIDKFVSALDHDMGPVEVPSFVAAVKAFPIAKAKLTKAEKALAAVVAPAAIAAEQKTFVTDADAMVTALETAIAGKLNGLSAAKITSLQAALTRAGNRLEVVVVKIDAAGYTLGS